MSTLYDVIIAGAGPIGLFLAGELALAHTKVLVLERDTTAESPWKQNPLGRRGLNTLSVESFQRRGLLGEFVDLEKRPMAPSKGAGFTFGGHFAGITINLNQLELNRFKYQLPGPALFPGPTTIDRLEKVLGERAERLGVTILRGRGVTDIIAQDDESVTVAAGENQSFRGRWLVGCDGGRSTVRKATGFDFVGSPPKFTGYAVHCDLDHADALPKGFNTKETGMYALAPGPSVYLVDFESVGFDRTQEITREHVQKILRRVSGNNEVNVTKIHLASSWTDRSMQATRYRKGRVLLAGDAAHIHSPLGAQGLNLGLGDAMNLGWKLAATIRQESGAGGATPNLTLLDTYEGERHSVGAWVLEWTRAQVSVLEPDPFGAAIQALVRDLIATDDGANLFLSRIWGLSQRYTLGSGEQHLLVGCSVPDFELPDGSRIGPKMETGHGMLADFRDSTVLQDLVESGTYAGRVDYVRTKATDQLGLGALMIRPDGIVAWVVEKGADADIDAAKAALEKWFAF